MLRLRSFKFENWKEPTKREKRERKMLSCCSIFWIQHFVFWQKKDRNELWISKEEEERKTFMLFSMFDSDFAFLFLFISILGKNSTNKKKFGAPLNWLHIIYYGWFDHRFSIRLSFHENSFHFEWHVKKCKTHTKH